MAGVEKQDAVLCFPLALQFHEQEIPAQKGPGKGWRRETVGPLLSAQD